MRRIRRRPTRKEMRRESRRQRPEAGGRSRKK
jgi:hypothetical protein